MRVVLFIFAQHADDVHDELQQLSVESLFLPRRRPIRGKLGDSFT